jgi:hypothetical protein
MTAISRSYSVSRIDFHPINRSYNSKSEISKTVIRRPLMVSGGKPARAARRPEREALGG